MRYENVMRDIFDVLFPQERLDPVEAARRSIRRRLHRRFYQEVRVTPAEGTFLIALDGRPVKTPARRNLAGPVHALAEVLAQEWRAQADTIDPATMPLTRLANSIIDAVTDAPGPVAMDVAKYLGSDLLFYRAENPGGLVARQTAAWDPLLAWAGEALGARFTLGQGLVYVEQPEEALAAAQAAIPRDPIDRNNAWRLGALHSITTLTGSGLIALAVLRGRLSADEAWDASNVDEDWNFQTWGRDEEALQRRTFRFAEMRAAARVLDSLRS